MRSLIIGSLAALALAAPATAQMSIQVFGNGSALACSRAAVAGAKDSWSEQLCTTALASEPLRRIDRAATFVNRGVIRLRRQAYAAATEDFNRALEVKPDVGEALVNRGAAAIGMGRFADGLADIDKALTLTLAEPEKAYYNRAVAHERLDDLKAAYFDYRKASELKPDWPEPRTQLARFSVTSR